MRCATSLLHLPTMVLLVSFAPGSDTQRYDGSWETTVSCPNGRGALGYSFQFSSTVTNGVLHGLHGKAGEPGSLQIDGTIGSDGKAPLYAKGLTGAAEYSVGALPRGTEYAYNVEAQFTDSTGIGKRVEGRPCLLKFVKK